jgi:hypothetical protein
VTTVKAEKEVADNSVCLFNSVAVRNYFLPNKIIFVN